MKLSPYRYALNVESPSILNFSTRFKTNHTPSETPQKGFKGCKVSSRIQSLIPQLKSKDLMKPLSKLKESITVKKISISLPPYCPITTKIDTSDSRIESALKGLISDRKRHVKLIKQLTPMKSRQTVSSHRPPPKEYVIRK